MTDAELAELDRRAREALAANVYRIDGACYLAAGFYQFRSLWTRDFCWSARGLLATGRHDVVRDHLQLLLGHLDANDALPRTFDDRDPRVRVVWGSMLRRARPLVGPLKAQWLDQFGRIAIDGNALVVLAVRDYVTATRDDAFWAHNRVRLRRALHLYERHVAADGLVHQHPFADWQDSLSRRGATFYTNLVYLAALEAVVHDASFGVSRDAIEHFRARIDETFYDPASGLYRSWFGRPHIALDGNLLAIELGYARAPDDLYASLRRHPLWTDPCGPGFVTLGELALREKAPQTWPMLRDYHTSLYWSWLMALSAKTAARMRDPDRAASILAELLRMARRDRTIAEVYTHAREHAMVRRPLYTSEAPFSWGAATIIDAVDFVQRQGV